jgi:hypothetical protein
LSYKPLLTAAIAGVVKQVDAGDSKSPELMLMSVRFRPPAPINHFSFVQFNLFELL